MKTLSILFLLCLIVLSCLENNNKFPKNQALQDSLMMESVVEQYTDSSEFFRYYDEQRRDSVTEYINLAAEIVKINLNGDAYADYFVIENFMGGISSGYFHDGETGKIMAFTGYIFSRPGIEINYQIVDVACGDNQQEIMVTTGSGGTAGLYYDYQIFRFNPDSNRVELIFTTCFYADDWHDEKPFQVSAIDLAYTVDSCIQDIRVTPGTFHPDSGLGKFGSHITPIADSTSKTYVFNIEKNEFELIR